MRLYLESPRTGGPSAARCGRLGALALAVGLMACGGSGPKGQETSTTATTDAHDSGHPAVPGPEILEVSAYTPDAPGLHLVKGLVVTTDTPSALEVTVTPDDDQAATVWAWDDPSTSHDVPIMGLRFGVAYTVSVRAESKAGGVSVCEGCAEIEAASPPEVWPNVEVSVSAPSRMEPGWTLLSFNTFNRSLGSYLAVLDEQGQFVWVLEVTGQGHDARLTPEGHLLTLIDHAFVEVDFLGQELGRWSSLESNVAGIPVEVPRFHHEAAQARGGGFLGLADHEEDADLYPQSYEDPTLLGPSRVLSHDIVEFDRDGQIQHRVALWDALDRSRIGFDSLESVRDTGALDWIHANAVLEVPGEDAYLISLRHQDAVVKITREGELRWILGNHDNWAPEFQPLLLAPADGTDWSYHPHAPAISPDGDRVLIFDNGNYRVSPFTGEEAPAFEDQYSRLVEYAVDEEAMTVEQTWSFEGPAGTRLFSYAVGDADYLPETGHVLGAYGFLTVVGGVEHEERGVGTASVRLMEVNPRTQDVLFDVTLDAPLESLPGGWHGYRAERIPAFGQK